MAIRTGEAQWHGTTSEGHGHLALGSGAFSGNYSFKSRFADGAGTNPEELIAGAHAGCYSMALAYALEQAGFTYESVDTDAKVHLDAVEGGFEITKIELHSVAAVEDISADEFQRIAAEVKLSCPVSKALAGATITLNAELVSTQHKLAA